jgi:uncharacterized protein
MTGNDTLFPLSRQKPVVQIVVSFFIFLASSLLFIGILYSIGYLVFPDWNHSREMLAAGSIEDASPSVIRFLQAGQGFCIFVIPALIISKLMSGDFTTFMGIKRSPSVSLLLLVALLACFVITINTFAGWINSRMVFPSSMNDMEKWMKAKEMLAERYTVILTSSSTSPNIAVNIIVIALLAAIGEEFFFRGILQQLFTNLTKSGILAVWITAILFSTIHLQFYGFLPRLILGLLYGYLFLWSRSIWLPAFAHFINNLIPVIIAFNRGWNEGSERSEQFVTGNPMAIIIAVIVVTGLLFVIRKELRTESLLK